jgi:ABC-type phosphate transport system substrate-binding protein
MWAAILTGLLVCAGVFTVTALNPGDDDGYAVPCADGSIRVSVPQTFQPTFTALISRYKGLCPSLDITTLTAGATPGPEADASFNLDGPSGVLAVVPYVMVVNTATEIDSLTLAQIRSVYQQEAANWAQVTGNGPDTRVTLVGRRSPSLDRTVFERSVLGAPAPAEGSADCAVGLPEAEPVLCHRNSPDELVDVVADIPGSMGYAPLTAVDGKPGVQAIKIDGFAADDVSIRAGNYPFVGRLAFSPRDEPVDGTPLADLYEYLRSDQAADILRRDGFFPCADIPNC